MTEPVRVDRHGVTVTKTVDTDAEDARVRLALESEWSKSIEVRVRDPVPSAGTVGIPGDQRERWNVTDDGLTFERVLEPETTVEAAYEVAVDDPDTAIDQLRMPPEIDVASAPASVTEAHAHVRGESVSTFCGPGPRPVRGASPEQADAAAEDASAASPVDGTAGSGPSEPATPDARNLFESLDGFSMPEDDDQETAAVLDEEIDTRERDDSASADAEVVDAADAETADATDAQAIDAETAGAADAGTADAPPDGGDLKAADESETDERRGESSDGRTDAAAGLEGDAVDHLEDEVVDGYLEWLLTEGPGAEAGRGSLEVRVRYLQSQFQDLAAYIDAMEEFLDEHGSGTQLLADLRTEMEAMNDRFDDLQTTQNALHSRLETVESSLETLQTRVETREESVDETVDELADLVETVEAAQRDVERDLEELKTFRQKLQDAI